jgi:hypothetical protein
VIGAADRDGNVAAEVLVDGFNTERAQNFIRAVSPFAEKLVADAYPAYQAMFGVPPHEIVNHHAGEYVRGDAHTNTIEGVWSLLKRQIVGTHHWVSRKHLQQYVSEMAWRMYPSKLKMLIQTTFIRHSDDYWSAATSRKLVRNTSR